MLLKTVKKLAFADWVLFASLLLIGGFHEYISCALSVAMSIYLLIRLTEKKTLTVRRDFLTSAVVAVCLGYGLTCLWAVDRGMALVGFLKFLPLFLYLLCLQQENAEQSLEWLPYFGAAMAILSAVGMQFSAVEALFAVAGRLAGFFQYPNTFAVFLLVCELLLLKKPAKRIWDYLTLAVLLGGLLYTGSRTAFLVAIVANAAMALCLSKGNVRTFLWIGLGGVCLLAVLLMLGENSVLRRYLTISLTESTFIGRLLYWVDALPLLAEYPLGMGYLGYYYTQQSVQTGVYSVMYIHNDFLQLVLDIGWVPAGLFFGALVAWFVKKSVPAADKIILGAVLLHSLFDFDLQFVGMFLLVLLLLSRDKTEKVMTVKPRLPLKLSFCVVALASLYIGAALMFAHLGDRQLADALYPYNTQNKLALLEQAEDMETANDLADDILKQNTAFFASYSIKAKQCYAKGDFVGLIQNQRAALERNPFAHTEYESYCKMLLKGIELYEKAGDSKSAEICKQELLSVEKQLAENTQRLSRLGKMIKDQPVTELSEAVRAQIRQLGG